MAIRWAVANGNWSNVATWDGGVALPGVGDTVYANGKTVTINTSINVLKLTTEINPSTNQSSGAFLVTTGGLTIYGDQVSGTSICLTSSHPSGLLTIVGSQYGAVGLSSWIHGFVNTSTGAVNIIGSQIGGSPLFVYGFYNTGNSVINITGNQIGGPQQANYGFFNAGNSVINITGNQIGGGHAAAYGFHNSAGSFTILGNQTANTASAILNTSTGVTLMVSGIAIASSSAPAISNNTNSPIIFDGKSFNNLSMLAIFTQKLFYKINSNSEWQFNDFDGNTKSLYGAGATIGQPSPSDVRYNTIYGANNDLVGTCHVPPKSSTVAGVPCDDGVGTFGFTPELITRLQNCATVESVGEQLEALI